MGPYLRLAMDAWPYRSGPLLTRPTLGSRSHPPTHRLLCNRYPGRACFHLSKPFLRFG